MVMRMKPGDIRTYYHEGHKVNYAIVLLSSDIEPGWETDEEVWRCAQFQMGSPAQLLGAQIVIYTKSELQKMIEHGSLGTRI
jgi:hypothetical protein